MSTPESPAPPVPVTDEPAPDGVAASGPLVDGEPETTDAPAAAPVGPVPRRTRTGSVWTAAVVSALVLLILLIFILQNLQRVKISFLAWHGHLPLAVALLLAAVLGVLLVAIPGTGRILQLRRNAKGLARRPK